MWIRDSSGTLRGCCRTGEEAAADKSMKALEEFLRPEFIGRVDEVIPFKPLSEESMVRIAGLMLDELTGVMKEKGIAFSYTRPVCELLAKKAAGGVRGARDLRNAVRRQVEDKVVDLMVAHCNEVIGSVRLSVSEVQIKIEHTLA